MQPQAWHVPAEHSLEILMPGIALGLESTVGSMVLKQAVF